MGKWTEAALAKEAAIRKTHGLLTDEQIYANKDALMIWRAGKEYKFGDVFTYQGRFYRVINKEPHTAAAEWLPDIAVSLYVEIPDPAVEWPDWKQPLGSEDAYPKEAKVTHDNKKWISTIENNTWEPGVFGWEEYLDG